MNESVASHSYQHLTHNKTFLGGWVRFIHGSHANRFLEAPLIVVYFKIVIVLLFPRGLLCTLKLH